MCTYVWEEEEGEMYGDCEEKGERYLGATVTYWQGSQSISPLPGQSRARITSHSFGLQ